VRRDSYRVVVATMLREYLAEMEHLAQVSSAP
jgi:hypothetical protein